MPRRRASSWTSARSLRSVALVKTKATKKTTAVRRATKKAGPTLRDVMTAPVFTLTAGQTASDAWALMRAEEVRHAVVLRGRTVIGILSDRDLGGPSGGAVRRGKTVADLMHDEPRVASADTSIVDAAVLVADGHVGCLPVLDGNKLVGIVTRGDLLRLLAPTKAAKKQGVKPGAAEIPRPPRLASPNVDKHL